VDRKLYESVGKLGSPRVFPIPLYVFYVVRVEFPFFPEVKAVFHLEASSDAMTMCRSASTVVPGLILK